MGIPKNQVMLLPQSSLKCSAKANYYKEQRQFEITASRIAFLNFFIISKCSKQTGTFGFGKKRRTAVLY